MGKENLCRAEDMAGERDVRPALASLQVQSQQLLLQNLSNGSGSNSAPGTSLAKLDNVDEFPCGMQILVVDDDPICLMVLERMLRRCSYRVMSGNGETSAVIMKGITGGACDYLLKPLRIEELRNIWQHVVRRKQPLRVVSQTTSVDIEGGGCEIENRGAAGDEADPTSSATHTTDGNLDLLAKFKEMHIARL